MFFSIRIANLRYQGWSCGHFWKLWSFRKLFLVCLSTLTIV